MTHVFMFPGQSSRYEGMLDAIVEAWSPARELVDSASELLGRDLLRLYHGAAESVFESNRNVQVGVFLASYLHMQALQARGVEAELSLGLSLGEYNHLVHIGALTFEEALRLVDARGRVYDAGPRGMMAAIFPADQEMVEELVERASEVGVIEIANFNSPSQFVIAGETDAVEAAMQMADDEFAVMPTPIERHIPMHTSVFRPVAGELLPHLEAAAWREPSRNYVSNVMGRVMDSASPQQFRELLAQHVYRPVKWRESIDAIVDRYPDATFIEVGPRGVLYNLLQKRWHSNRKFKTDATDGIAANLDSLVAALSGESAAEASGAAGRSVGHAVPAGGAHV